MKQLTLKSAAEAVSVLQAKSRVVPEAAVVLGSGVRVLENLDEEIVLPYKEVFGAAPGVEGHAGTISLGKLNGKHIAVLRGRFHLYEGYDWDLVTLPARTLALWSVPRLFLTNAAGGLNPGFRVGDLMVITAYRDLLHPKWKETGLIPAIQSEAVSCRNTLVESLLATAKKLAEQDAQFRPVQAGTYVAMLGPNYETLAEISVSRKLGCDAVGMSTAPEFIAVQGSQTTAAAVSVITNVWSDKEVVGGHEEVLHAAREASKRLDTLFRAAI